MSAWIWPAVSALCVAVATWCWPARPRPVPVARTVAAANQASVPWRRARARPPFRSRTPGRSALLGGLVVDLVAAALDAGLPPAQSVAAAALAVRDPTQPSGARSDGATGDVSLTGALVVPPGPDWDAVRRGLLLSDLTGVPAAALLRDAAGQQRTARRTAAETAAARLGVRLVLPLGLTVLPSFVLLGVAPVVLGLARGLLQG